MATFPIEQPAQRAVLGVSITFTILTFIFVSLRLVAHQIAHKPWTLSDYLTIMAAVRYPIETKSAVRLDANETI